LNQAFQEKSPPKAIDRLVAQFSHEMRDVDAVIRERLGSKVDLIPDSAAIWSMPAAKIAAAIYPSWCQHVWPHQ
jgi:hypothetical protein